MSDDKRLITFTVGEHRIEKSGSVRCYSFAVTNTGRRIPMKDSPDFRYLWMQKKGDEVLGEREVTLGYEVKNLPTIIMCWKREMFGRPRASMEVEILLDPKGDEFEITGFNGFGGVQATGRIDKEVLKKYADDLRIRIIRPADEGGNSADLGIVFAKRVPDKQVEGEDAPYPTRSGRKVRAVTKAKKDRR